tara:strand:+ start:107 stop:307 length:201 start_codon:yes stop_codon:yes gene_type:complete
MKKLSKKDSKKEQDRIRAFLDKHSTKENPVAAVLEKSTKGIHYVMRLEDVLNMPPRKRKPPDELKD